MLDTLPVFGVMSGGCEGNRKQQRRLFLKLFYMSGREIGKGLLIMPHVDRGGQDHAVKAFEVGVIRIGKREKLHRVTMIGDPVGDPPRDLSCLPLAGGISNQYGHRPLH